MLVLTHLNWFSSSLRGCNSQFEKHFIRCLQSRKDLISSLQTCFLWSPVYGKESWTESIKQRRFGAWEWPYTWSQCTWVQGTRLQLQDPAEAPVNHGHILLSFNATNVVSFGCKKKNPKDTEVWEDYKRVYEQVEMDRFQEAHPTKTDSWRNRKSEWSISSKETEPILKNLTKKKII